MPLLTASHEVKKLYIVALFYDSGFKSSAFKPTADFERQTALGFTLYSCFWQSLRENSDRSFGKLSVTDKGGINTAGCGYGYEKSQSTAAFAAVKRYIICFKNICTVIVFDFSFFIFLNDL